MPYVAVENFKTGLDRRRMAVTSPAGSLRTAKNVHITRGGEVESRRKLASKYTLPVGSFDLARLAGNLYVFGSIADPGVPAGVTYQRLQHPSGSAMTAVRSWTISAGKLYVIAEYADGSVLHFYNGVEVTDWRSGIVRADMINMAGVATHLASLVDASDNYISTSLASVITITSALNRPFTITVAEDNGGATDDQTIVAATTQQAVENVTETLASGSFTLMGGEVSAGVNTIASVVVNSITITSGAVDYAATPELTAAAIAANINAFTSAPDYRATAVGAKVVVTAVAGSGSTPNSFGIQVTITGNVQVVTGTFRISGGTASAGVNKVSLVKVNGVEILNVAVDWITSNSVTATNVAAQINTFTSTPDYKAFAVGPDIYICPLVVTQTSPANLVLAVTVGGNVTIENQTAVNTTVVKLTGGVTASTGQPQISTVTLGGTFEVGDKFTITLKTADLEEVFGYDRVSGQIGSVALSHRSKVYVAADEILAFSGVKEPTKFNGTVVGAGIIDMSTEAEGAEELTGLGVYQNNLAVFARRVTQIWAMDPDPDVNSVLQVLPNVGTTSPRSVVSYGESDVFFLADSGVRSLRARTGINTAAVNDIGTPIDELIAQDFRDLGDVVAKKAFGILDPVDGRYLLFLGPYVYVFTYFDGLKVSAWSRYEPGFTADAAVPLDRQIYVRSGDTIYLYGGDTGLEYDADEEIVELPFLSANTMATAKDIEGLDLAIEGEWNVYLCLDPNTVTVAEPYGAEDHLGIFWETTIMQHAMKAVGESPVFKLRFVKAKAQYGRIGMVIGHYDLGEAS